MAPVQPDLHRFPNAPDQQSCGIRFDIFGSLAAQPEQDCPVSCMALAGQRQRTEEPGLEPGDIAQPAGIGQPLDKQGRRQHRPHGVRTRRSDADLEQFECAGDHIASGPLSTAHFGNPLVDALLQYAER